MIDENVRPYPIISEIIQESELPGPTLENLVNLSIHGLREEGRGDEAFWVPGSIYETVRQLALKNPQSATAVIKLLMP